MSTQQVAYFCMEYGLSSELPIYSGGLGILAGDHMKAVGDLDAPVVGIGIFWSQGYTTQRISEQGGAQSTAAPAPRDALAATNVQVSVAIEGRDVPLTVWRVSRYTTAELYLLEPTHEADRALCERLYGGDQRTRIAQEIILGIGGVRVLRALGKDIGVYHFNEGHAVFAAHELLREQLDNGLDFDAARAVVREQIVFTTHTPVPAGNEVHELDMLMGLGAGAGLEREQLQELGGAPYSMTAAGLGISRCANAVAELHAETAREMWKGVAGAAPIFAVTNGVHRRTWQDERVREIVAGPESDATLGARVADVHMRAKAELLAEIAARTGTQLDKHRLLIGFARRAATYKRADLIFGDPERLGALLESKVQLVFSGKAHPADDPGNAVVERIVGFARRWPESVVFLENYDMTLGAALTRGCDVWLNNPVRPMEACGTSGMKAAMNGVLNFSILDGWWPEGCVHEENGWRIEHAEAGEKQDEADRNNLFGVLEQAIIPTYYEKTETWRQMMLASIRMSQERFSAARMVNEYMTRVYKIA